MSTLRVWRITAQLSAGELIAWGVLYYTFAVCLPFMQADLGWGHARLSMGFSLALLISGLGAPLLGAWADRHGTRTLMVLGAAAGAAGVLLWSQATTMAVYLLAW